MSKIGTGRADGRALIRNRIAWSRWKDRGPSGELNSSLTGEDGWTLREQAAIVADVGLTGRRRVVPLFRSDEAIDMASAAVDSGYFRVLRPVAGRFFGEEEDQSDHPEQPAVLTESAWRMHFGSDPSVVGRARRWRR